MANGTCKSKGCILKLADFQSKDPDFCLFHASIENKGLDETQFKEKLNQRFEMRNFNFSGYIFPYDIRFSDIGSIALGNTLNLADAKFHGDAIFEHYTFGDFQTKFNNCTFYKAAIFERAIFNTEIKFKKVTFVGPANFNRAIFNEYCSFEDECDFIGKVDFGHATFKKGLFFNRNIVRSLMVFSKIIIDPNFEFVFERIFLTGQENPAGYSDYALIVFDGIKFNEFLTRFDFIGYNPEVTIGPFLLFRFCQLKDVYFINCNMSMISFYSSIFDNAIILSSNWKYVTGKCLIFSYRRRNVIAEDIMFDEIIKIIKTDQRNDSGMSLKLRKYWELEQMGDYDTAVWNNLALLYRRFKTALDRTKDYHEASWAYFNEFEMKRRSLKESIENYIPKKKLLKYEPPIYILRNFKKMFSRYCLYNLYKIFAGYGEKPLWSLVWYLIFSFLFSIAHFISGLDISGGVCSPHEIQLSNYSSLSTFISWKLILDLGKCFLYTISLTVPRSYLSTSISGYADTGDYGQIISSFNSIIMLFFVVMIAVGLKRHFRRF
jgi:hypothetical protein